MSDVELFTKAFEPDYYLPHGRIRDAVSRNRMFNILNQETIIKIDCVIRKNDEFQITAFNRRKKVNYASDFYIWIISKEDLILSKLNWAKNTQSEMQLRDVGNLIRNDYDEKYVEEWAEKLGVTELLERCLTLLGENYVKGYDS